MNTVPTQQKPGIPGLEQLDTVQGSDKVFGERAAAAYEAIAKQAKAALPADAKPEDFKAKIVELAEPVLKAAVTGNELTAKAADAMRESIKKAKDADDFARLLTLDRDKIVLDSPAGQGGQSAASERLMAVMMQFLEKILAGFGVKLDGQRVAGGGRLSNTFAGASGSGQQAPQAFVGPPEPDKPATPANMTPQQIEAAVGGQKPTVTVADPQAPTVAVDITAANDIDFATVTDGSRPVAAFTPQKPQTFEQRLDVALPVKPEGPFTVVLAVPAAPPLKVDLAQSNTLAGLFNMPANPRPEVVLRVDARPQPQMIADVADLEAAAYKPKASNDGTYALAG